MSTTHSEAAIRETLERLREAFTQKSGDVFASAFAPIHDYVVINGMLVKDMTREANAQVHNDLFRGTQRGSLGHDLSRMDAPETEVRGIRFLSPEIAVVHLVNRFGEQTVTIVSLVMQQQPDGEWLIVSFHNAPILPAGPPSPPP